MNYSSYLSPQAGEKRKTCSPQHATRRRDGGCPMATLVEQLQPFPSSVQALAGRGDAAGAGGGVWVPYYFIYSI